MIHPLEKLQKDLDLDTPSFCLLLGCSTVWYELVRKGQIKKLSVKVLKQLDEICTNGKEIAHDYTIWRNTRRAEILEQVKGKIENDNSN